MKWLLKSSSLFRLNIFKKQDFLHLFQIKNLNRLNAVADMKIQPSSFKSDNKEIGKDVEQCHFSHETFFCFGNFSYFSLKMLLYLK